MVIWVYVLDLYNGTELSEETCLIEDKCMVKPSGTCRSAVQAQQSMEYARCLTSEIQA